MLPREKGQSKMALEGLAGHLCVCVCVCVCVCTSNDYTIYVN